jgi:hypothetical protein
LSAFLLIDIPWFLTEEKLAAIFIKTFSWGLPIGWSFTTSQQAFWHHHHRAITHLHSPASPSSIPFRFEEEVIFFLSSPIWQTCRQQGHIAGCLRRPSPIPLTTVTLFSSIYTF